MTHITHNQSGLAARLRQLTVGLLVAGSVFAVTATEAVDARPRTKSEVVAAEADRALDALASWQATQAPADYVRFVQARSETAALLAAEVEADDDLLSAEWAATTTEKQQALLAALSQLGVPYQRLRSIPDVAFDCSGLTIWAFRMAGLEIPRVSRDQFRASAERDHDQAQPGDLVYYPGHISIYLGADLMVHSPNSGSHVEVVQIPTKKSLRFGDIADTVIAANEASRPELLSTTPVDRSAPVTK